MADATLEQTPATKAAPKENDDAQAAAAAARQEARKTWFIRIGIGVAIVALLFGLWYVLIGRNHVATDNAYVNAEVAQITPLVSAQVVAVNVSDTQMVKRGDILVKLDDTNMRIALAQAEADLARMKRKFQQASATSAAMAAQVDARGADIVQRRAQMASAEADFNKAKVDLDRRLALAPSGAVSGDELTSARKGFAAAKAALDLARAGVTQAQSNRGAAQSEYIASEALVRGSNVNTDPDVLSAIAKRDAAKLDVDRAIIRAPIDGVVTKRMVQVGQRVAQGAQIMTIVPLDKVYVEANFKERQLRRVKVGQPVELTADLYGGDVVYHGKVAGFAGGTGSSFALIPAQNATGNWIKIVQRVPVRVTLDPKELAEHPLRVGLSMDAEIDLSGN